MANDQELSAQPLQAEHAAARRFALSCVYFSLSMAVHAAPMPSVLHRSHTTTFELPTDLHFCVQNAQVSDPKYEDIIKLEDDLD